MDRSRIAIVIPALNEKNTIAAVVASALAFGRAVVVDDGSSDDTGALAAHAGADVVRHAVNRGYDEALNSGFRQADELGCEYAITCDADGQHNAAQIAEFIALLDAGHELVVGVRNRRARWGEQLFAFVARRLWGLSDPMCGMKAYRMSLYRKHRPFDSVRSIGSELAIRGAASGASVAERRIVVRDRADAPRFGGSFKANLRILRALFKLLALGAAGRLAR
jgi:glycosyltransferase involved in cell wall biosynthesis